MSDEPRVARLHLVGDDEEQPAPVARIAEAVTAAAGAPPSSSAGPAEDGAAGRSVTADPGRARSGSSGARSGPPGQWPGVADLAAVGDVGPAVQGVADLRDLDRRPDPDDEPGDETGATTRAGGSVDLGRIEAPPGGQPTPVARIGTGPAATPRGRSGARPPASPRRSEPRRPGTRATASDGHSTAGLAAADGSPGTANPGPDADGSPAPPTPGVDRRRRGPKQIDPGADPVAAAKEICLALLTDRARTKHELAIALRRRGVPDEAAATALERFDEVGLIDDAAFAGQWVRSRQRTRGLARRALAVELRRKGVDDDTAGEALAEVDAASEEQRARELVDRKLRTVPAGTPDQRATAARRLVGMLARKGYPGGIAYRVVREALAAHGAEIDELGEEPSAEE